ncbi:hypothetical protein [Oceanobacillus luteolus]|uniref:hypothetical protein n=1 Tax=Oceanobacillus luteolus TaxID=1274358 RepID=UPI0036D21E74
MHSRQRSSVVDATLRELFIRNVRTEQAHRSTMLVLLFHHMNELQRDFKELIDFHQHGIRIRICPAEHLLELYDVTELARQTRIDDWITLQNAEKHKEQFEHFYIPNLPFSAVSDLVSFNDARTSIRLLLWALMKGRSVTAFSQGADPYHPVWQEADLHHGNAYLKREMKQQLQKVRGLGIRLIEKEEDLLQHFLNRTEKGVNPVITADTILNYAKDGKRYIEVDKGTIITPLARDTAREYHMEIGEKEGR